ncbi:coiled-coil domain-containing protein 190 [Rhinophrynus dorsalis]
MQRAKLLGSNADKQWEAERRGAKRAEARLSNGIHEIDEAQLYHVNSMTKEQKRIQRDLERIKQASNKTKNTNSRSLPPGRQQIHPTSSCGSGQSSGLEMRGQRRQSIDDDDDIKYFVCILSTGKKSATTLGPVMASGSSMTLQMRINDFMDGVSSRKGKTESPSVHMPRSDSSFSGVNLTEVTNSVVKKLSISENPMEFETFSSEGKSSGPEQICDNEQIVTKPSTEEETSKSLSFNQPPSRQRRGSLFKEKPVFDEDVYAPDGGLRTVLTMPDFMESLDKAKNARYIRHRYKPDFEKELSVNEIFQNNSLDTDTDSSKNNGND